MLTDRLEVRPPLEPDRQRFVGLFRDEAFMAFSAGALDRAGAERRFDSMLARARDIPFAKQPIIERATGVIVGYVGVDTFELDGRSWLEFGWRLVPEARGHGYATEATRALLRVAERTFQGELLAMIDPRNLPSQNVARKVGFAFWRDTAIDGDPVQLYLLQIHRRRPSKS